MKITETIESYLENFMSNKPRMNTVHISKLSLLKQSNHDQPPEVQQANVQPNLQLIPIKLDLEFEGRRLKDMFLWDKNEPYLNLESFSKILMEEHNLPAVFENEITANMKKQIH